MQKHESAFTLIELMVTIAVAAVVLTLGAPGFGRVIERNQLSAQINELVSTLHFARSEAVRRNDDLKVCHSADGVNCGGAGYEVGWIIFIDDDGDDVWDDPAEELIRVNEALSNNYTLHVNGNMDSFFYRAKGRTSDQGRFVLCKNGDLTKSRAIFIGPSGRARLAPLDPNGTPIDNSGVAITSCL
jgi:type IV fimbrial biogenesis protein FimT